MTLLEKTKNTPYFTNLGECDVASVSEWRDDKPWCVAEVLVTVAELSVANVGVTVPLTLVPPGRSEKNIRLEH